MGYEQVVKALKAGKIVGIGYISIDFVNQNSETKVHSLIYSGRPRFRPLLEAETFLKEKEIYKLIKEFRGFYSFDDVLDDGPITYRYFSLERPQNLNWHCSKPE